LATKIRHIALSVQDPEGTAKFYEEAFGLVRVGKTTSVLADGVYLSDGYLNIALLKYKSDEMAGMKGGAEFVGTHHFGFQVDDAAESKKRIEECGGKFFMDNYTAQKYDNPPEAYGAFAYAAMALILDSIEKVGPDRKKVIDEMAKVKDRDSIVGKITFDDHGQNTVPVITKYVIQDGKFVEWDDSEYASGKRKLPGQK